MAEAEWVLEDIRTGAILTSRPPEIVDSVSNPLALFQAQAYLQPPFGDGPVLQTPIVADGNEGVLAHNAVAALLQTIASASPDDDARVRAAMHTLVKRHDSGLFDPTDIESVRHTTHEALNTLEDNGLLPHGIYAP
jgi:hypothetical protein